MREQSILRALPSAVRGLVARTMLMHDVRSVPIEIDWFAETQQATQNSTRPPAESPGYEPEDNDDDSREYCSIDCLIFWFTFGYFAGDTVVFYLQ